MRLVAAALCALAVLVVAGGCGSSRPRTAAASGPSFAGATLEHALPERPVVLDDYRGRRVDLRQYRGKAVLLTFLYTHCPDVCPAIAGELSVALDELGPAARKVQLVAVSADPRGDTPAAVASFVREHHLTGRIEYLIGNRSELQRVWASWDVAATPDAHSDEVAHSALVYGITASGRVVTIYPANARPSQMASDVPKLASM